MEESAPVQWRRHYSLDAAQRALAACLEIKANGQVPTAPEISKRARLSRSATGYILHDADWWTEEDSKAGRRVVTRIMRSAAQVKAAYDEIKAEGLMPTRRMIAQRAGLKKTTCDLILRDADWWQSEGAKVASEVGRARGSATMKARGHSESTRARLRCANIGLTRSPTSRVAASIARRNRPSQPTDGGRIRGRIIDSRILSYIWETTSNGATAINAAEVGRALDIQRATVWWHIKRLRAEGLIDEHNRPITPSPASEGGTA